VKIVLPVKPLSINDAFRGRHFPTKAKTFYETTLAWMLPRKRLAPGPFYRITFDFYLVRFKATDYDNLIKVTQDCLVRSGIIDDDRLIIDARIRKFPAKKDRIKITIEPAELEDPRRA
jgi:Holliday junction resolvase RusA-like endonuclease